ncbi:oligosaccharide flippase family protein [Accumulibacter sp.]|uniref:oligosaccharide flippase family protein n=1 Tax=Accumulibacter sp. TaxID=2053492 RepID=UPI00261FB368|nr:oligosaccharide flippase family protein [Accumulibacter sp.]
MIADSISLRSIKALFWGTGGAVGKVAGQLLVQITLARILGPEVFGQFAVVLLVLSLGGALADCGFGAALIQKKEISSADVSLALGWSMSIAVASAVVISLMAPFLAKQFGDDSLVPMLTASAFLFVPQAMGNLSTNLLQRDLHMKSIQIIHLIAYTVFFGGVATILAVLGWGAWSLIIAYAAQTGFKVVATYSICRHTLRPHLRGNRALISFGLKALANDLTNWFIDNFDRFLIGKFWGLFSLGLYSVAFNLSKAPLGVMLYAVKNIAFASAARLQGNIAAVKKGLQVVLTAIALTTLPPFAIIAFESEAVLNMVYGSKWIEAAPYMSALALSIPLISFGSIIASILRGTGAIGTELRVQILTAALFFSGIVILSGLSLAVAVWVVPAAYLLRLIVFLGVIRDRFDLTIADLLSPFRGAMVLTLAGVGVAAFVHHSAPLATVIGFGVLPLLAGGCTVVILIVYRFKWFVGVPLAEMLRSTFPTGPLRSTIVWLERGRS